MYDVNLNKCLIVVQSLMLMLRCVKKMESSKFSTHGVQSLHYLLIRGIYIYNYYRYGNSPLVSAHTHKLASEFVDSVHITLKTHCTIISNHLLINHLLYSNIEE